MEQQRPIIRLSDDVFFDFQTVTKYALNQDGDVVITRPSAENELEIVEGAEAEVLWASLIELSLDRRKPSAAKE